MSRGDGIWRRRLVLWLPPLLFFALNLAFFSTYRLVYADRMEAKRDDLEERQERLASLERQAQELSHRVATARSSRERMEVLYRDRLSTERNRFTAVTSEVRELARRAGLDPAAMSYPSEEIEDYGLRNRYFTFNVEGTYVELRQFINLLELTPSFITLEQVRLSDDEGARLKIQLTLSTLFVEEEQMPELVAEEVGP